ncbi:MAG: FAD-dependent oxidoreductase, partial [Priestia megaterium]
MKRVVIIGGVAAGMSSASQLRRMKEKEEVEILVFEKGGDISYSACGMPYSLSGVVKEKDDLVARTKQEFEERNISVHLLLREKDG